MAPMNYLIEYEKVSECSYEKIYLSISGPEFQKDNNIYALLNSTGRYDKMATNGLINNTENRYDYKKSSKNKTATKNNNVSLKNLNEIKNQKNSILLLQQINDDPEQKDSIVTTPSRLSRANIEKNTLSNNRMKMFNNEPNVDLNKDSNNILFSTSKILASRRSKSIEDYKFKSQSKNKISN